MITVRQADEILAAEALALPCQNVPLCDATGRVLREDIKADRDLPPYDRVMMDGFALSSAAYAGGLRRFAVERVCHAGEPQAALQDAQACIEVMTGAVLPAGCDAVVPVEDAKQRDGRMEITGPVDVAPGRFVHPQGSDAAAGEVLVPQGTRVTGPVASACASVGAATVLVSREPQAALVTTGDEAVPVESAPGRHEIRNSNGPAVAAILAGYGAGAVYEDHAADSQHALEPILAKGLEAADALAVMGGVSMGKRDLVPSVLERLGVEVRFHRVSQKPGKPLWFGARSDGTAVFGLPGNPVSAMTCARRYVVPYLLRAQGISGAPRYARLSGGLAGGSALTRFVPVTAAYHEDGYLTAEPRPVRTSGDLAAIALSDGFVEAPPSAEDIQPGATLPYYPWSP